MVFKNLLLIVSLLATNMYVKSQVVINELMQSNIDCIMDDLNEFPDSWVELYNAGETDVNLANFKLGDTDNAEEAWQLPKQMLGAKQYVLVYCDKSETGFHTHFRLDSGKGSVFLFQNGSIVDQVAYKKQLAPNIAYGRKTDGDSSWGYQLSPTPAKSNCGKTTSNLLGEPVFSLPGYVKTTNESLELSITVPEGTPAGTIIRYTLDGSEPTSNSKAYTEPILINSSYVVRAKLFCDGYLSPRSTTHSYIRFPRNLTLPVVSIAINYEYLNDSKIGIYVEGNYQPGKKNYEFDWRRPINFEYFENENENSKLNQLCETRILGGATRGSFLKSLAVYANKRFGTKRLNYEFFPDQRPGVTDFKSIALRNAGNDFDFLYMRDAIIQRSMAEHVDLDWQSWSPVIVYINGAYKGILNIRDRSNEDNIYTYYDGLEDIDMFENWCELKEGTWDNFNAFRNFYAEHGHTMAEYEKWMDCYEFINLMIMNLYYNNQDFPGNNIVMWRPRTEDGRWRWIAKDTDFGIGLYGSSAEYKTLEWLHNPNYDKDRAWANQYDHTRLFRRLMEDDDFSREFIDRTAIYMGDFLNEKGVRSIWDRMYDMIKYEYPYHRRLINQWWPNYNQELSNARDWLNKRTNIFYKQIADFYQLGSPIALQINQSVSEEELKQSSISFNGVNLSENKFDGKFFANRDVTLSATPTQEKEVIGWEITQEEDNGAQTKSQVSGTTFTFKMPSCKKLSINAILGDTSGINSVVHTDFSWRIDSGMLIISGVPDGMHVKLYSINGILLNQVQSAGTDIHLKLTKDCPYIVKAGTKSKMLIK